MQYAGNRLMSVTDGNSAPMLYDYDADGNRSSDGRTGLEFSYNILNLPCEVHDGQQNMQMRYTYLSDGTKVSALDAAGNGLLYRGNFVYEKTGNTVNLESVAWDEGRIRNTEFLAQHDDELIEIGDTLAVIDPLPDLPWHPGLHATDDQLQPDSGELVDETAFEHAALFQDQWFVRDHLGNVRSVIDLSGSQNASTASLILEQDDYLPYGTKVVNGSQSSLSSNRYRYARKEEQRIGSFNSQLLDFGARSYDPWACRWTTVDPLAHKYFGMSPYNYCGNDPVNRFDPDGADIYIIDNSGNITFFAEEENDDDHDFLIAIIGPDNYSYIRIVDKTILPSMSTGPKASDESTEKDDYAPGNSSRQDMINIFKFAANTFDNQEWGLYYNGDSYELTTQGNGSQVGTSLDGVTWKAHSHPNEKANDRAEIESMGYETRSNSTYDKNGKLLDKNAAWRESVYYYNDASQYIRSGIPSYVYFPVSGNSYRLTKKQLPYKTTIK